MGASPLPLLQAVNKTNMQIARFGINFKHIVTDLKFFASYHQTIDAFGDLINHDDQNRNLSEDISLFSRGSKIYDQIRILDSTGMEFIRIDFKTFFVSCCQKCDFLVNIPMLGSVECLNVSVAAGVCLFEAVRQRLKS